MQGIKPALPQGSRILVTGSNGFIGSHVVDQLLNLGYLVRGTVRDSKPWLNELFDGKYGKGIFETIILSDVTSAVECEKAVEGISGIVHVAADVSMNPDPSILITNAVEATLTILTAASKQPTVERFVLTSSSAAAYTPRPNEEGIIINEETWNDAVVNAAWEGNTPSHAKGYVVYAASKTETEKMAFKWIEENNSPFILNTVLPAITFGKILAPEIRGSTQSLVRNLLKGDGFAMNFIPPQWYVDVVDVARLHVAALLSPSLRFDRIFAFAAAQNWTEIVKILRKLRPNNTLIPQEPENEGRDMSEVIPSKRAESILKTFFNRPGWVGLEESINDGISGM